MKALSFYAVSFMLLITLSNKSFSQEKTTISEQDFSLSLYSHVHY